MPKLANCQLIISKMSGQHAITATSGMRLFSRVKTSKLCKIILITRKRRQADWRFDPFFIDSKNSSDLRFRDGFAADSPLQRRVHQTSPATLQTRGVGSPREWVFVHKWLNENAPT